MIFNGRWTRKDLAGIFLMAILSLFSSCFERNERDARKAYKLWAGEVPRDVKVIHGKYWQSSHFSNEYILYLEVKAPITWRRNF